MIVITDKNKINKILMALAEFKKLQDPTYPLDLLSYDQNPNSKEPLNLPQDYYNEVKWKQRIIKILSKYI